MQPHLSLFTNTGISDYTKLSVFVFTEVVLFNAIHLSFLTSWLQCYLFTKLSMCFQSAVVGFMLIATFVFNIHICIIIPYIYVL